MFGRRVLKPPNPDVELQRLTSSSLSDSSDFMDPSTSVPPSSLFMTPQKYSPPYPDPTHTASGSGSWFVCGMSERSVRECMCLGIFLCVFLLSFICLFFGLVYLKVNEVQNELAQIDVEALNSNLILFSENPVGFSMGEESKVNLQTSMKVMGSMMGQTNDQFNATHLIPRFTQGTSDMLTFINETRFTMERVIPSIINKLEHGLSTANMTLYVLDVIIPQFIGTGQDFIATMQRLSNAFGSGSNPP